VLSRSAEPRPEAEYATDRHGVIFLLLIGSIAFMTFVDDSSLARAVVGIALVGAVVGTLRATGVSPFQMRVALVVGGALIVAVIAGELSAVDEVEAAVAFLVACAVGFAGWTLIRRIFEQPMVMLREVVAALSAYIEFAMAFAFLYMSVARIGEDAFFANGVVGGMSDFVYFSVVTITTLGYGDLTPATDIGRSIAMVETLFGQIFLVVLVAFLVGMLGRRGWRHGEDAAGE
jgi:hypothetical protein